MGGTKFSIRDVLWLTVVVALAAAWGIDRSRQSARIRELEELLPHDVQEAAESALQQIENETGQAK